MGLNDSLGIDIDVEDVEEKVKDAVLSEGAFQVGAEELANLLGFTIDDVKMRKITTEVESILHEYKAKTNSCSWSLDVYTKTIPWFCGERVMVMYVHPISDYGITLELVSENGTRYIDTTPFPIIAWNEEDGPHAGMIAVHYHEPSELNPSECYYVGFVGAAREHGGKLEACEWSGSLGLYDLHCGCDGLSLTELVDEYVKQFLSDDYEANIDKAQSWADSGSGCSFGDTSDYSSSYEKQDPEKIADTIIDDIVENRYEGVFAEVPSTSARAVTVKQALDTLYALVNEEEEE